MLQYCGVILLSLALGLALDHDHQLPWSRFSDEDAVPPQSAHIETVEEPADSDDEVMGSCYFGDVPSGVCRFKCFTKNKNAYCDDEGECLCRPYDEDGDSQEDDNDDGTNYSVVVTYYPTADTYTETDTGVEGSCWLGQFPSATCKLRCFVKGQTPFCDEDSNCRCQERPWESPLNSTELNNIEHTLEKPPIATHDTDQNIEGICLFGQFPSVTCSLHCLMRSQTAVCDEEGNCRCQDSDWDTHAVTSTEHSDREHSLGLPAPYFTDSQNEVLLQNNSPGIKVYIINLFSLENDSDDDDLKLESPSSENNLFNTSHGYWCFTDILAIAVLILLTVLVAVEVTLFCKRRNISHKTDHLQTIVTPPKLDKGYINEKQ